MRHKVFLTLLIAGVCWMGVVHGAVAETVSAGLPPSCDAAGSAAEKQYDVPTGLLLAIGRVESGRRDPATGRVVPWAWTINAEGKGQLFESAADALSTTRALQQAGVASIDVGCFQVNLMHHPMAFGTLEEGFDPARNADYAARFLVSLRAKTGSWEQAVGAYHSATPERGNPYRDRVLAGWSREGGPTVPSLAVAMPVPPAPFAIRVMTWRPAPAASGVGGMHIWTPSAAGQGPTVIRITRG